MAVTPEELELKSLNKENQILQEQTFSSNMNAKQKDSKEKTAFESLSDALFKAELDTDNAIAKANLDKSQLDTLIQLEGEHKKQTAISQYNKKEDDRFRRQLFNSLNPYQSSNRSVGEEFTKNLQESFNNEADLDYQLNQAIPLETQQALDKANLKFLQHIDTVKLNGTLASDNIRKMFYRNIDNLKDQQEQLQNYTKSMMALANSQYLDAYAKSNNMIAEDYYGATMGVRGYDITSPFESLGTLIGDLLVEPAASLFGVFDLGLRATVGAETDSERWIRGLLGLSQRRHQLSSSANDYYGAIDKYINPSYLIGTVGVTLIPSVAISKAANYGVKGIKGGIKGFLSVRETANIFNDAKIKALDDIAKRKKLIETRLTSSTLSQKAIDNYSIAWKELDNIEKSLSKASVTDRIDARALSESLGAMDAKASKIMGKDKLNNALNRMDNLSTNRSELLGALAGIATANGNDLLGIAKSISGISGLGLMWLSGIGEILEARGEKGWDNVTYSDMITSALMKSVDIVGSIAITQMPHKFKGALGEFLAPNNSGKFKNMLRGIADIGVEGFAIEGFGEGLQEYFKLQGANNWQLPSLDQILLSNSPLWQQEKRQIQESMLLGTIGGLGVAGGFKAIGGITNIASDIKGKFSNNEDKTPKSQDLTKGNDSLEYSAELQTKTFRAMQKAIHGENNPNVDAKTTEYQNKITTLENDIKTKEKEVKESLAKENIDANLKDDKVYNNNAGKIQQLEYIKSKLSQESESVKRIDELIENYKKLDNVNNALDNASVMLDVKESDKSNTDNNQTRIRNKDKFNKALDKLLDFHNLDTKDSTQSLREIYQELKESLNMSRDDVQSLIELMETKDKASGNEVSSKINEKDRQDSDESYYDATERKEPEEPQSDSQNNAEDAQESATETQNKNKASKEAQEQQTAQNESKDTLDNTKQDNSSLNGINNINQLSSEEIEKMTQDDINKLFDRLSPEATLFVIAQTQERARMANPDGRTEANKGFENLKRRFSLIRVPYAMAEGTREDSAKSPITTEDSSMFRFMDKEIMLVANNFYDADSNSINSIRKDSDVVNPIQRALNAINDINANTYEGLIKDIEDAIANNDSKLAEQKVDELKARFQENVSKVGRHMILINALISSNPSSPLAKQLRLNANIASRTLKSIKSEMIKLSKQLGNKNIEELGDNTLSNILDSISQNSLAIFNKLKFKIRESRTLDNTAEDYKSKQSTLNTFIKRALQAFKLIANKLNDLFNDKEFQQTFDNTITLLEQGNSALLSNLATQRKIRLNINNTTQEITLNGINDLAEVYFFDILYNTFNIKEYGIDSKAILLNKILTSVFSKDGKNQDIVDILNYLKEDLQDIKITLPLLIENYENIRLGKPASEEAKNITFSLYDLINADETLLGNIFESYLDTKENVGETTSDKIQYYKGDLQKRLNELLNNKKNEIAKEIFNRLSIQIAINDNLSNKLDALLQIGLLAQSYTAVKNPVLDEKGNAIVLKGENANEYTPRNPANFESTELAFLRSLLGDAKETNSDDSLRALLEVSKLMANNYMEYKTMKDSNGKSIPLIDASQKHLGKGVFAIHKQLMKKLDLHNKESFDNWLKIIGNQELAFNNINDVLTAFEKFANKVGIKDSDKKAMMMNLQMTGKTLYSKNNENDRNHTVAIFNKIFNRNIHEVYNELSRNINDPEGHIESQEYESRKNSFIVKLQDKSNKAKYKQLIEDIHNGKKNINDESVQKELKQLPICYIPIRQKQYDSKNNVISDKTIYVFSPSMSMLNKHFANQVNLSNSNTNALETLFDIGGHSSLNEVLGTIDGRLQQNGEYAFKLFNAYENVTFKDDKTYTKNFKDKIDYSEDTYYLSDLLPNNRVANKIANTEQDNKILRESSSYVLPKTIKVYENGKIVEKPNTDVLQWNGNKPANADEVSPNGKYKEHYYGMLYSLAMTFGVDFDKVKLVNKSNKSKEQNQKDFESAVKSLNDLHNQLAEEKDINKQAKIQEKIIKKYERLNNKFEIDYTYEGQSLSKLLDGLLRDNEEAKSKYKELWSKRVREDMNVFSEHPGISIKNGRTFLEAIKSGNFIDNIQTQNLIVYADGKATFSAQNSVRFNSIEEIDALSGVLKGNISSNQFGFNTTLPFIKEQAILARIKDKVDVFAKKNKNFDNYKAILANKGIDAYTIAIGPTTLTMRGLSNTNTLFTSLFSQELFDRDLIKKPTQAPSYGQEVNSILESYIEAIKIPFNRTLFRLFENSNFLNETLSNKKTIKETLVELNTNQNHPNKEKYQSEIIAAFKKVLDKQVLDAKTNIDNKIQNGNKITDFERIEYELLKGLQNNFTNPSNIKNMLFNNGKTTNILTYFTQNGKQTINYTNLSNYFFEEKNGVLLKDKDIIINYYENFDFVKDQTINRDMLQNANNIVNITNDNANNKAFFKKQNKKWFEGFKNIKDKKTTIIFNDYMIIQYEEGNTSLTIEFKETLNGEIADIKKQLGEINLSDKVIKTIIVNTLQFYISSEGSFLPEHKPLALKANPTLAIVRQNNAYIKEQRQLIENKLIEVFDEATNNILLDAYRKLSGKENTNVLTDKEFKRLQQAFDNNEEIIIDRATNKKIFFREYIFDKKNKVLKQFIDNVYGDFWAKDNKNLYVQIFKKHPNLDEKSRFAKLIDTSNNELDNRLQNLLTKKLLLGGSNTYSSLSETKTIMSDVIGQFNHPFEALLITAMNNPTTQIFDAYIGNANNIVRFMDTWNKSLASLSGANTDSAVILNNFYNSLSTSMNEALSNNNIKPLDSNEVKTDKMIRDNNTKGLIDLVRFNLNLLRHTIQLSSTDRALANNAVGLHTINNSEFQSLSQNNSQIYALENKAVDTITSILNKLERNDIKESRDLLNMLKNNIDYNIFGEEDINLNNPIFESNKTTKEKINVLYYENKNKITDQTRKLLDETFNFGLKEVRETNPNIIRTIFQNVIKTRQVFSTNHEVLNINKKTSAVDISNDIFGKESLGISLINNVLKAINVEEQIADEVILKLKDKKQKVSITNIAETILSVKIANKIKPLLVNDTTKDINSILNSIDYSKLVIDANAINANGKVSIDGIKIDISEEVEQETQLLIDLFNTNEFKAVLSNEIKKVKQTIENNSNIGKTSIVINRKSYRNAIDGIRRLTNATASATQLNIVNGVKSDTLFFNKDTSNKYYDMFFNDKEKDGIKNNINNFRDTKIEEKDDTDIDDNIIYDTNEQAVEQNDTNAQDNVDDTQNIQKDTQEGQKQNNQNSQNKQNLKSENSPNDLQDSDEILGDDYSSNVTSTNEKLVEQSLQDYQKDMNNDLKAMKQDKSNKNIVNEITMIESLVNGLIANLKKGIRFFNSDRNTSTRGVFKPSENKVIIYNGANRGTRTHEFLHAALHFAFNNMSNETKYYISQISNIHREVRAYLDSLSDADRTAKIKEIFSDYTKDASDANKRYNYIFGQSNDINLQEFCSVALTSPRLIEFLNGEEFTQWLNRVPSFKVEANSRLGKLIKAIPALIGYIYKLIKNRLSQEPRNGFKILTTSVSKLSNYNTEEGQLAEQTKYESGRIYRANATLRRAGLVITKNVEHYIDKMKKLNPDYNVDNEMNEIQNDLSKKINEISKNVRALRALDNELKLGRINRIQRTIKTGIWLLQSIYYNNLGLKNLMSSPIKHQFVANAMHELRQAAIENTIFDARIMLDLGINSTKFLKNFVNSVNRALSFRTELDANKEVASSNIAKQVSLILARPNGLAERFAKDKKFKEAYSEGVSKLIIHQNLGDYFFGDENVNRKDLNVLVDFVLNDNEEINNNIKEVKKAKIASAIRALGIEEDSAIHKSIAKIVDSMGITRITDKKNSLGTQNIEQMLKELEIDFENNVNGDKALKELHQAITLSAILAPRTNGRDIFKYVNSKTETFRKTYMNSNKKTQQEIRESIKDLIVLHKDKLDKLYTQKVLNFNSKEVQENLKNTKLEQMYYMNTENNYINTTAFDYKKSTAYYSDSYKPSEYNQSVTLVTLDKTKDTFKKEKEILLKKGFKLELVSSTSPTETFKYDGWIDYNSGKDRRGFMYRAMTHKGQVIQFLEQDEVERLKPKINEDYKRMRKQELLDYGKDYKDDYIFDNAEFNDLTKGNKSFAGSETMIRDNISIKQLEEWTELDTSLESAFRSMERTIQDNIVRNLNNNLIFQQVLLSNKEIDDRKVEHHTEVLFRIGLDRNGKPRVTFNNALTDKYGFELTDKDVSDFAKLYKAMNNGKLPNKAEIKIDTRMIGILFGFDVPTFSSVVEDNPVRFKIWRAFETVVRFLVKETRNNTIIRNPNLVWENFKGNIVGLIGEGVPLKDIFSTMPFYIEELNKYQRDMKEKVRISNEIVMKEKKEYRDKKGISAEAQANEVKQLKKQLALITDNMKTNAVAPLMGQGLYTNIVEDAETSGWKWDKILLDFVSNKQNLTKGQTVFLNELFMTEQSDVYQTMAYLTRLGDFIPRVILYYHIMGKGRQTINGVKETNTQLKRRALDEARDRFINYNTPMWSPILRLLDRFGFTNYAKYAFNCEKQIITAFAKSPVNAMGVMSLQLGLDAMGVNKMLIPSSYLTETFIVDGKLPSGFLNPTTPLSTFTSNLNRWNYVTP